MLSNFCGFLFALVANCGELLENHVSLAHSFEKVIEYDDTQ